MARQTETRKDEQAIQYLYGGDDVELICWRIKRVHVRFKQKCCSIYHGKRTKTIPAGQEAVRETAKVDGKFGTAYTCLSCIDKALKELGERS